MNQFFDDTFMYELIMFGLICMHDKFDLNKHCKWNTMTTAGPDNTKQTNHVRQTHFNNVGQTYYPQTSNVSENCSDLGAISA